MQFAVNKDVTLTFSDGSTQAFMLQDNGELQAFAVVPAVSTTSVRLTVTSFYTDWGANGARAIRYSGFCGITEGDCRVCSQRWTAGLPVCE